MRMAATNGSGSSAPQSHPFCPTRWNRARCNVIGLSHVNGLYRAVEGWDAEHCDIARLHIALRAARLGWAALAALGAFALAPAAAQADDAGASTPPTPETWAFHAQVTSVSQYHPAFSAAYSSPNSLNDGNRGDTTNDVTIDLGVRPWRGAEIWLDPEIDQGFGLDNTLGVAGFHQRRGL